MKYHVNDNCIGCGMCEGTCPEVFHLDGFKAEAVNADVNNPDAEEAMSNCPAGAIEQIG